MNDSRDFVVIFSFYFFALYGMIRAGMDIAYFLF